MMPKKKKKKNEQDEEKWRHSPKKELLQEWLEDGTVKQDNSAKKVYVMNDGYFKQFPHKNFVSNLRNLKKVVKKTGPGSF
jgi:hypothetical protein